MAEPTLSWLVNDAGAYVLAISAVPAEHLHRPLVITVGDDTVLDETNPVGTAGWCAWCEEAEAPTYIRGDGHDPECPLQRRASWNEVRAVGHTHPETGLEPMRLALDERPCARGLSPRSPTSSQPSDPSGPNIAASSSG